MDSIKYFDYFAIFRVTKRTANKVYFVLSSPGVVL